MHRTKYEIKTVPCTSGKKTWQIVHPDDREKLERLRKHGWIHFRTSPMRYHLRRRKDVDWGAALLPDEVLNGSTSQKKPPSTNESTTAPTTSDEDDE